MSRCMNVGMCALWLLSALLLDTAATSFVPSPPNNRALGCYWYPKQCAEPGMALTDRNIRPHSKNEVQTLENGGGAQSFATLRHPEEV